MHVTVLEDHTQDLHECKNATKSDSWSRCKLLDFQASDLGLSTALTLQHIKH